MEPRLYMMSRLTKRSPVIDNRSTTTEVCLRIQNALVGTKVVDATLGDGFLVNYLFTFRESSGVYKWPFND